MIFWLLAAVMAALVVIALLWPLLRRGNVAGPASAEFDRAVYRDQLTELEQDRRRGLINDSEAEAARREIERRLLQADSAGDGPATRGNAGWPRRLAAALVIGLPPLVGVALYLHLGTPGLPGFPLAERDPGGPLEVGMMVAQLQDRIAGNPRDIEARLVLAQIHERTGDFATAATVYRDAIAQVKTQGEVPAVLHAALGETLVAASQGRVVREARLAFAAAIQADPGNSRARYYAGLAMAQDERLKDAIAVWQDLAADSPPGSPLLPLLQQQIARAAGELGIEPPAIAQPQPPAPGGPSADDVEAAQEMTPQDRQAFIRSMVTQLAARLEEEPADPDGWLRLTRAYTVLGEGDKARAALASAEAQIAALPEAAPERAGFTERLEALRRSLP